LGALIAVLPLFHYPYSQDQYILPKIALGGVLISAALAWWGAGWALGRKLRVRMEPIARGAAVFWAAHVVGWLTAWQGGSSHALATERLGWVTGVFLFFWLLQDFARGRRRYLLALAWLMIASGSAMALWALAEDLGPLLGWERAGRFAHRLEDWRGRIGAGLGNTGHIADWIGLTFPPALLLLLRVRKKRFAALLMAHLTLGALAMIVCWSVHSNAGLIAGGLFLLVYLARRRRQLLKRRFGRIALQIALWGAAVAFWAFPHPLNPREGGIFQEAFASQRWKDGGSTRLAIWAGTLSMIRDRPIFGWGTGNFSYGYPQALNTLIPEESPLARYAGAWTNAAHNVLLQLWAELGLIGLAAALFLVAMWVRTLRRTLGWGNPFNDDVRLIAATQGVIICCHAMMNFPLQLPSFLIFYATLAATPLLLVDRNRLLREEEMEFEFQWRQLNVSVRGEGMIALRGVGMELRLEPRWRRVMIGAFGVVALWGVWASGRCLLSNIHYNRGYAIVQHQGGQPADEALRVFEKSLRLRPGFPDALSDRAKLRYQRAEWPEVLADTEAALRQLQAPKLLLWRGEAFLRLGRKAEAVQTLATVEARLHPWESLREGPLELGTLEMKRLQTLPPATAYANY
jgi:O-antigen ligase